MRRLAPLTTHTSELVFFIVKNNPKQWDDIWLHVQVDSSPRIVRVPAQRSIERSAMMMHPCARAASRPGRDRNGRTLITDSLVKQPTSFPRPHCCVRALPLCFTHPQRGVGGAPRDVRVFAR